MLTQRQSDILNWLIGDYINSAKPVSSQALEKGHELGICPATVRLEMQELTEQGFLFQPHTSSGRVPTDKGYRFFVNNILASRDVAENKDIGDGGEREILFKMEEAIRQNNEHVLKWASRLTKFLAKTSSNFVVLNLSEKDIVFREGWEEILEEPEFEERRLVSDFINFLKDFENSGEPAKTNSDLEIEIFIGKEVGLQSGEHFSIISSNCSFSDWEGSVSILGPKRMAYDKNIGLINSLTKLLAGIENF